MPMSILQFTKKRLSRGYEYVDTICSLQSLLNKATLFLCKIELKVRIPDTETIQAGGTFVYDYTQSHRQQRICHYSWKLPSQKWSPRQVRPTLLIVVLAPVAALSFFEMVILTYPQSHHRGSVYRIHRQQSHRSTFDWSRCAFQWPPDEWGIDPSPSCIGRMSLHCYGP